MDSSKTCENTIQSTSDQFMVIAFPPMYSELNRVCISTDLLTCSFQSSMLECSNVTRYLFVKYRRGHIHMKSIYFDCRCLRNLRFRSFSAFYIFIYLMWTIQLFHSFCESLVTPLPVLWPEFVFGISKFEMNILDCKLSGLTVTLILTTLESKVIEFKS